MDGSALFFAHAARILDGREPRRPENLARHAKDRSEWEFPSHHLKNFRRSLRYSTDCFLKPG
jgi:hypothetical protein